MWPVAPLEKSETDGMVTNVWVVNLFDPEKKQLFKWVCVRK